MSIETLGQNMTELSFIEKFIDSFDNEIVKNKEVVSDPSYIIRISLEIILLVIGEFAGVLLISMLNHEGQQNTKPKGTLVKEVLKTSTIIQMLQRPVLLLIRMLSDFQFQFQLSSSRWLCMSMHLIIFYSKMYTFFVSLIIALMRFVFIIKQDRVMTYGIEKTKHVFYLSSLLIPFAITLLMEGFADHAHNQNKVYNCWSGLHNNYTDGYTINGSLNNIEFHSPIHMFIKSLVAEEALVSMKWATLSLIFFTCSNVTEALIYFRIHRHIKK